MTNRIYQKFSNDRIKGKLDTLKSGILQGASSSELDEASLDALLLSESVPDTELGVEIEAEESDERVSTWSALESESEESSELAVSVFCFLCSKTPKPRF